MGRFHPQHLGLALLCLTVTACGSVSDSDSGGCTVSCGGFGTGDPFTSTQYMFISESECREEGERRSGSCRASYCPPTGNESDCYQVYP